MAYHIKRPEQKGTFIYSEKDFRRACKWLLDNACVLGGGDFEIWRVEKRGRNEVREFECSYSE